MIFDVPYMLALAITAGFAVMAGSEARVRTALAIVLNWCAIAAFVLVTDVDDPFWFMAIMDFAAALAILARPASVPQGVIGASYLIQIAVHTAYAIVLAVKQPEGAAYWSAKTLYLDTLTWVGWGQMLTLFLWSGGGHVRKFRDLLRLRRGGGGLDTAHHKGAE